MKTFLSHKQIGFAVFAVVVAAVALFAVMPMLPDIDSSSRISFAALIAEGSVSTPTCTLDASPESIKEGESSTISWTTSNAVTVRISQNIGPVSDNGSVKVSPKESTTYTLTAKNSEGAEVKCKTYVAVTPNPTPAPTCTLKATPSFIDKGASSKLTWTTTNAQTVTIDQGIGGVVKSGSRNVSPAESKTYTLTARGEGGLVRCNTKVTVNQPNPAPTCTLVAKPTGIEKGESSELIWTTRDAHTVTIDQGIGGVAKNSSKVVSPNETTTYKLTAKGGGGTVTCTTKVTVKEPVPAPTCTLVAKPGNIEKGETSKLTWTTHDAKTVNINQGIGGVVKNGSKNVSPSESTTYTLTAKGDGGTVKCSTDVKVTQPTPVPTCTLVAKPGSIEKGELSTLVWTTRDAQTVSINQGIGSVAKNDSRNVQPTQTTTYTLTAKGDGGTVHCSANVAVSQPTPAPTCTLVAKPGNIEKGESSELIWTTRDAKKVTIDQGIGQVSKNDSRNVTPAKTTLYTLTAKGDGGTVHCSTKVKVTQPTPAPTCTLSPESQVITLGNIAKLSYAVTNTDTLTLVTQTGDDQKETETLAIPDGIINKTPDQDTTLTLVATNTSTGKSATCEATITVQQHDAPTCFLTLNKSDITKGDKVRASYEVTNSDRVKVTRVLLGVQGRTKLEDTTATSGSVVDTPPSVGTFVYRVVATGPGGQVECKDRVVVNDTPEPNLLTCNAFSASPTNLPVGGGDTTLTWDTTNATAVTIDNGVGTVDLDGQKVVAVTDDTTFTLTATRDDETITCDTTVTVEKNGGGGGGGNTNPSCDAFTASPNSHGVGGGQTTLTWNTSDATNVRISGIGDNLDLDGSTTVNVDNTTTYTLVATDDDGDEDSCAVTIDVSTGGGGGGGGGGSPKPRCELFEVSERLPNGDIVLHWETSRGTDMKIEPGVLDTSDNDYIAKGFATVTPQTNTRYVLTVERGSRDDTCTLDTDPNVTVISDRQPVTSLSLSQVPYTGFDAGPMLTGLFYTILVLWSLAIAYVLVIQRGTVFGFSLAGQKQETALHVSESVLPHNEYRQSIALHQEETTTAEEVPFNLPTGSLEDTQSAQPVPVYGYQSAVEMDTEEDSSYLENHSHEKQALLSSDAIRMIQDAEDTPEEQIALLDMVINRAKESYPREDGWLVINRQRISELLGAVSETKEHVQPVVADARVGAKEMTHSLTEAIVVGNVAGAYQCLGTEPMLALAEAASDLDRIYRARRGGVDAGDVLLQKAAHLSDRQLEGAIEALVSAIDGTYIDEAAAVKLAIVKSIKAVV